MRLPHALRSREAGFLISDYTVQSIDTPDGTFQDVDVACHPRIPSERTRLRNGTGSKTGNSVRSIFSRVHYDGAESGRELRYVNYVEWPRKSGRDGEIGRRSGLKIRRSERTVGVRFPLPAPPETHILTRVLSIWFGLASVAAAGSSGPS